MVRDPPFTSVDCLTPDLASSTSNGHERLHLVLGDMLRFAA
jgi:hypothetical protein